MSNSPVKEASKQKCSFGGNDVLYYLDFFGKTLNIQIFGKGKYPTLIGAVLGVLSLISILILSTYFIVQLLERTNLSIMFNQDRDLIPVNDMSHIPMSFKIIDGLGNIVQPNGLYEIDVIMSSYTIVKKPDGNPIVQYTPKTISYNKCDINNTFGEFKEMYKNFPYVNDFYCITPNSNNLTLYSKYSDSVNGFSYINFYLNRCVNSTSNNNSCMSNSEIDKRLSNVYFAFALIDYQIDHYNVDKPHRPVVKITSAFSMSSNLLKRYYYFIRQVFYNTDYGYIFKDSKQESFYQIDNYQLDVRIPGVSLSSSSNFGILTLTNENKVDIYFRSYEKFQSIIASIGGVIKGIFFGASIINYIFTRNYSLLKIVSSVIDFDEENNQVIENKSSPISNFPSIYLSTNAMIKNDISNNNNNLIKNENINNNDNKFIRANSRLKHFGRPLKYN